jgi:predicted ester cyclase
MSQEETNKEIVRRYFDERWNTRNYGVVDELDGGGDIEEHKAWLARAHALFSESRLTIGDMVAEGDRVALHWKTAGVLRDQYEGFGSPGEHVSYSGIALLRIAEGKIVDDVAYSEGFGSVLLGQTYQQRSASQKGVDKPITH